MRLLKDEMEGDSVSASIHSSVENDLVSSLLVFQSIEESRSGICYCATAEQLLHEVEIHGLDSVSSGEMLPRRLSLVCIGEPPPAFLKSVRCDVIWMDDTEGDFAAVFNKVARVFKYYLEWQESLADVIKKRGNVEELFKISVGIIKNDLWLIDMYDRVVLYRVYKNVRLNQEQLDEIHENEYLPDRMILDGREERRLGWDFVTPGPKFRLMKAHNAIVAHCPIYVLGAYRLAVVIESNWREVGERDYCLIIILADYVRSLYSNPDILVHPEYEIGSNSFLRELLDGNSVDRSKIERSLAPLGWDCQRDECVCCCIDFADTQRAFPEILETEPRLSICDRLRKSCICRTFLYGKKIFALVNLSKSVLSLANFVQRLPQIILCDGAICGTSDTFVDVMEAKGRYAQAEKAFESLFASGEHGVVTFSDAMVNIVVDQMLAIFPAECLVSKELDDLIRRDTEKDSHLWETLKVYLDTNCNIAETCRELYLQRGGALYRLSKIQEMLPSFDLKDPDDRLQLMLRLKIVERSLQGIDSEL